MTVIADELYCAFEERELPGDGSQAWVGLLVVAVSGSISLATICWLVTIVVHLFIH